MKKYRISYAVNEVVINPMDGIYDVYTRIGSNTWERKYDSQQCCVCPICGAIGTECCDGALPVVTTDDLRAEISELYNKYGDDLFWASTNRYIPYVGIYQ